MSAGQKLLRAANATEHREFFAKDANAALDRALAAQQPKRFGAVGTARMLFLLADLERQEALQK